MPAPTIPAFDVRMARDHDGTISILVDHVEVARAEAGLAAALEAAVRATLDRVSMELAVERAVEHRSAQEE